MEKIEGDKNGIIVQVFTVLCLPALIFLHVLHPESATLGLYSGCPWWHRVTFHFFHAGYFHMLINWWMLVTASFMIRFKALDVIVLFVLASLYPLPGTDAIVGLSALVYSMVGTASVFFRNRLHVIIALLATILITGLVPHIAIGIHLWSYVAGLAYGCLKKRYGYKLS